MNFGLWVRFNPCILSSKVSRFKASDRDFILIFVEIYIHIFVPGLRIYIKKVTQVQHRLINPTNSRGNAVRIDASYQFPS